MGFVGVPFYGKDLGSAIEQAEKIIKKIKSNKYTVVDVRNLHSVLSEIENVVTFAEEK